MRIAVTGGLGFIGHEIVFRLIKACHEVIVVDFWKTLIPSYERARLPILERTYYNISHCVEVLQPHEFIGQLKNLGPHVIVHAGAVVDTMDLGDGGLWEQNVDYTKSLCAAASEAGSHIVFLSSAATYGAGGTPNNPYGLSKVIGERSVRGIKGRSSILRLFNVFGQNEHHKGDMASVPWKLAQAYRLGNAFEMHSPDAKRDFVPVGAVVDTVLSELDRISGPMTIKCNTLDVGTGTATSFEDLDNFMMQVTGNTYSRVKIIPQPPKLIGRYQGYTCAGVRDVDRCDSTWTTRDGLKFYYGNQ